MTTTNNNYAVTQSQNYLFFAQPYDASANGFYFSDSEEFSDTINNIRNEYGQKVEEFEIQFIDGERIDAQVCDAIGIHQGNIIPVMEKLDEWDDWQKTLVIIAVGECGYDFNPAGDAPEDFDIDVYDVDSMRELAQQFVNEGLFGEISEHLRFYIDYDAIARDLGFDYTETEIDNRTMIYRCG